MYKKQKTMLWNVVLLLTLQINVSQQKFFWSSYQVATVVNFMYRWGWGGPVGLFGKFPTEYLTISSELMPYINLLRVFTSSQQSNNNKVITNFNGSQGQIWELNILIFTHHTVCLISVTVCSYSLGLLRTSLEDVWSWSWRAPAPLTNPAQPLSWGFFLLLSLKTLFPSTSKCGKTSSWFPVL